MATTDRMRDVVKGVAALATRSRMLISLKWWGETVVQGFLHDNCLLRASALTYVTALAIVPFFAVAFSVSKGLGFQNSMYIRELLLRVFAQNSNLVDQVIGYINNTNVGTLGIIGVASIVVTVFLLFNNIESSFNVIWGVTTGRTPVRKFTDYLTLILICPFLVITSLSTTAYLQKSHVLEQIMGATMLGGFRAVVIGFVLPLLPVVLGLFVIYTVIPNVKVKFGSALIGALVSSILLQSTQMYFISRSMEGSQYNAIYGSFAQVPLAFLLMYWSWVVVLLGAEVSYAMQNFKESDKGGVGTAMTPLVRIQAALELLTLLARAARLGEPPLASHVLAPKIRLSLKDTNKILEELVHLGFVVQIIREEGDGYGLYRLPQSLTLMEIIRSMLSCDTCPGSRPLREVDADVEQALHAFYQSAVASRENVTLEEFAKKQDHKGGEPALENKGQVV
ncbi:YhjD/YihY/BrkB family envelope integrity protein [Desulfoplanes formicivorans]|uniref:Ribonuclease BN n=1 Tax=Desulfoplanes formicivorans TaxID=1592317 RepID=A0A194AH05_9BACT|nr:YhjD/YihY/BrkB family envelope integrity protein [Desulfoplanes formicivorans]GAU09362.1 ribonuclease BN [Desulfoplanes formicivorans]